MDVAVLGLGLIGGSVLQALAAAGHRAVGFDADPATRATARTAAAQARSGARWQVAGTIRDALRDTDVCVLAVPFPALPAVLTDLAGYPGLVTDVTSIKEPVRELTGDLRYVGGHPMAGKETSGFRAADRGLFVGCAWVLCLEPDTDTADWLDLAGLITALGARVVPATAAEHDRAVAGISHVPHLLAAALTGVIEGNPLAASLAAGSFRDGTRVAATRPELIAAMCGGNADAVGAALDQVLETLQALRTELSAPDPVAALRPLLAPASAARAAWPPVPGDQTELPARKDVLLRLGRVGGWVTDVDRESRKVIAMRPESGRNSS
ncbi:prephenate dehydrogenase/arogenate dehydrogenase family protein [Actinoplanes sp. NBRC 103695]|uniref:prephenate dehydrogenase/arogenate dehydrogenase family protein n=1 Tax=Actinoplanes sp. NBRC 103695 TaxID=3032202 RepID=UPI002556C725|nr:prephenate dehydrogenase/arogenate dehydrogenase family protein [Actinoplanes sp. NBRC 103695]